MIKLHHVAISTAEFERYVEFFEKLGMSVRRTAGEKPKRQLWFNEGIQINEVTDAGDKVDHIALGVDNFHDTLELALNNDCSPINNKDNWFKLPNGVSIELMEE